MRRMRRMATVAMLAVFATVGGAGAALAATDDPTDTEVTFDVPSTTLEYGQYWALSATARNASFVVGPWVATGTFTGGPPDYTPAITDYQSDPMTQIAYIAASESARPLGAGQYSATLTFTEANGLGTAYTTATPATLTITPAALAVTLSITADPSNGANAIMSAELTGAFRDSFYSASSPGGPLSPAGSWRLQVTDEGGEVVHELSVDRTDTDDVMGVSSYWSDVPPGVYTARATFVPSGASAQNFTIAAPSPVTYTAAAPPGSTSTATPAPPAPPETEQGGLTLPGWIPLVAGILTLGLIALAVVQLVRFRRAIPAEGSGA